MTKSSTSTQGVTPKVLIESGLGMAIHSKNANSVIAQVAWPDLTFHPPADQSGSLMEPSQWRDAVNPHEGGAAGMIAMDTNFLDHVPEPIAVTTLFT